jgi:hypothetical protein
MFCYNIILFAMFFKLSKWKKERKEKEPMQKELGA